MDKLDYDFVVVGSGINSLVCAALLAKAGHKVCVLERNHPAGVPARGFFRSTSAGGDLPRL